MLIRTNATGGGWDWEWNMQFSSSIQMFQNEIHCTVPAGDYNSTLNWTTLKESQGVDMSQQQEIADFVTHSEFRPYATTIGIYNDFGELIVVGSLARPIRMIDNSDLTFIIKFDTDQRIGTNRLESGKVLLTQPGLGDLTK